MCRPTYEALKTFGRFVRAHPQLLEARRLSSVAFGFEWQHFSGCAPVDEAFFRNGLRHSLMQSSYQPKHIELTDLSDIDQPLVLAGLTSMSAAAQRRVAGMHTAMLGGAAEAFRSLFPALQGERNIFSELPRSSRAAPKFQGAR